jgi:Tfp pilus assembly protein PilF
MAKQKLNVKFLAIFLSIAAILLVTGTLIGLVIYRNDPIKHITTGDGYMANGQFESASKSYFRAFGKDPYQTADYRPIDKSIEAVRSIVPKTEIDARDRQNQILSLVANKAIYAPDPAEREATIRQQVIPIMRGIGIREGLLSTLINRGDLSNEIRASLEGMLLEADWMNASKRSASEWKATRDDLQELIKLDPANARNQYGLLRGDLEQAFQESTNSLKIRAATQPFSDALAAARESAGPALEFDAIEAERNLRIAEMGLKDQDLEGRGVELPDPQRIATLVQAIRDAAANSPTESDRARFESIQRIFIANHGNSWMNSRNPELSTACNFELLDGIMAVSSAIYAIDPEDFRGTANQLNTMALVSQEEAEADRLALEELMAEERLVEGASTPAEIRIAEKKAARVALAKELISLARGPMGGGKDIDGAFSSSVNLNEVYFKRMQKIARRVVLDEAIEIHRAMRGGLASQDLALALEDVEASLDSYLLEFEVQNDPEINKAVLAVETLRGENLESRGRVAESRGAFAKAATAYNQLVSFGLENEESLTPDELDAAILSARKTGQFGVATGIKRRYANRIPGLWTDPAFLQDFAQDLLNEGRLEESRRYALQAQEISKEKGDAARVAVLEKILAEIGNRAQPGSSTTLAGTELLADDSVALASGDHAERQRILNSIINTPEGDPTIDRRVRVEALRRLIGIADNKNDDESLREFAEKLRELKPDDTLAAMILESESKSYIDRARALARINVEQESGLDYAPEDLDVVVASYLREYLRSTSVAFESDEAPSAEYKTQRATVQAEEKRLNDSILAIEDDKKSPAVLKYVIRRSLSAEWRDEEKARVCIELLRELDGDSEFTIQSQLMLYRIAGEQDKALELAERACDEMGFGTAEIRFAYGLLLAMRNDRDGALRQWRLANEQSPRDVRVAVALSDLLAASGETSQALEVLRRTNLAVGSSNPAFRERWLDAEETIGDTLSVINERRRVFDVNPGNIGNAIALAQGLMQFRIDREDLTEETKDPQTGEMVMTPIYSDREWARLSVAEKDTRITLQVRERVDEAALVLKKLRGFDDTDPNVIIAISRFQRQAGDKPESDRELEEAIDRLSAMADEPENRRALLLLEQGRSLWGNGSRVAAREKFKAAIDLEAEDSVEITALTAEFLRNANEIGEAIPLQERLLARVKSGGSRTVIIRLVARDLVTSYLAENEFDKADLLIAEYVDPASINYGEQIVIGRLELARASQKWKSSGDRQGAVKQIEKAIALADAAAAMPESQEDAPLLRADALQLQLATMTDSEAAKEVLEAATQSYRRAIAFERRDWKTRLAFVQFLVRNFEYETAVSELEQFIGIRNDIPDASIRLANLLDTRLDQSGKAIQVAQQALNRAPKNLYLINLNASLREKRKEFDLAAGLYSRAYEMTEQPAFLAREIRVRMNRIPPDFNAVLKLARAHPAEFAKDPATAAAYATAVKLAAVQQGRGLRQFEDVYSSFKAKTDVNITENAADPFMLARAEEYQERVMEVIAFWYPWLFGSQKNDGGFDYKAKDATAMAGFIEQVSQGSPSLHDLLQLSRAWSEAGNQGLAVESLERALKLKSISEGGRYATSVRLGTLLLNLDEPDCERAMELFERAAVARPQEELVKNNLAYAILKCGRDLKRALALSLEAVEFRPASPSFRDTLGGIYFAMAESLDESDPDRLEYLRAAQQESKIVLKIDPKNLDYRIRIAAVFLSLKKCGDARSALKMAGDGGPTPKQQDEIDALTEKLADCERDQ